MPVVALLVLLILVLVLEFSSEGRGRERGRERGGERERPFRIMLCVRTARFLRRKHSCLGKKNSQNPKKPLSSGRFSVI